MSSPENVDLDLVKKEELSEGGQQEAAGYKEIYACTYCDRKYLYHTALITHMNIHLKKYQCQHCERCYGSYYNLKMHERTHTGEKPFSCPNCDKSFPRRSSLRVHYKTCIKPEEPAEPAPRLFECDKCDKRYATKGGLKQHRSVHTDKYKCDLCDARCHSKAALRTHRRIHTGERPFACQQCPYRARDKSVLNTHKKICKGNLLNRRRVYAYETPGRPINPRELPDLRVIEEDLMGDCVPSENLGEIEELERDYFRDEAGEYVLWHDIFDSPSKKPPPAKRSEEGEVCTFKAVMGEVLDDHQSGGGQEEIQFKFNEVTDEIVHLAPLPDVHHFLFAEPKIRSIGQLSAPARPGFWTDEATKGVEKKIENPVSEDVPLQESFKFEESPAKTSIERYLQKEIVELKKDFKSQMMLQKQDFDEKIELQMQGYMRSAESQIRVIDTVAAIGEKIKQLGLELERMQKQQNRIHKKLCDFCREEGEISSSEDESVGPLLPVR